MARRMSFRRALNQAARDQFSAGKISRRECFAVHWASWFHHDELRGTIIEMAVTSGALPPEAGETPEAIDWADLIETIIELLPQILEFIAALLILFV